MGCTYSGQSSRNEGAVRSFRVHNVDDQGVKLSRGNIEIRDNDLLLYQKGKEPIRWPLHCLRRYGFDAELFSFESGRRSATGAGIYAFKCAHAEALFNLVQESIQRAGEEAQRGQQPQPQPHVNHTVAAPPGNQPLMDWGVPVPGGPPHHHESFSHFVPPPGADDSPDMQHAGREGSSHLYVNGVVNRDNPQHEYLNAGPQVGAIGAFQIDETAALIEFLHHPPGFGGGNGRSQVNYAELYMPEAPASVENLVEEASGGGPGPLHQPQPTIVERRAGSRLSQHSVGEVAVPRHDNYRLSMPSDLGGASQDDDSVLQSTDSDVFLTDTAAENMACLNYVNVAIEEGMGAAAAPTIPTSSAAMPPLDAVLPPTHEVVAGPATNCAYLAFEPPRAARGNRQANYIVIDHQNPGQEGAGAPASLSNQSPTSPTSGVSLPESPSKKRESYAMIDFNRTAALSNATRPVTMEEEGGRKTRHNSTISDMP